jgi:autophagy-related protein 2
MFFTQSTPHKPSFSLTNPTLALSVDVPSVHAIMSKPVLDGLQYWGDDVTQLLERTYGSDTDTGKAESRDTSLIGSRFFAKSRSGSGSGISANSGEASHETVVKIAVCEGRTIGAYHISF